ncbi:putative Peptidoglycan domain protein [Acinetobacter baumannii 6014059]|uniref:Putative Peptidoglycan domain protein n=9 Tax=Gammaproteobacteria TaxID=1236 RepID=A0A828SHD8_ACIBA|nr:putative Peptidoglycan domain protein [Acinetobacter baumannii 6014059]
MISKANSCLALIKMRTTLMNIEQYLDALIKREGGYVNDPLDHGHATKFGITQAVARSYGYQGTMENLTLETAREIYRNQYWLEPRFDQVNLISALVAEELFDTGVNCGISFTKPLLQRALNLLNRQGKEDWVDLKVDGEYGPATLQALIKYIKNRGKEGEKVLVRLLNIMQGQRYIEITETNPKHEQFFYVWLANRISL